MSNLQAIKVYLDFLSDVKLTAPTRGKREYQLAEYKKAYALLLDTMPIWDGSFEIREASMRANNHLKRLSNEFVESELIIEAGRIISAASSMEKN